MAVVGSTGVVLGEDEMRGYATDWRKRYFGRPLAVVRPKSTAEVSAVVAICAERRIGVVPQGGNTGLCGGATPDASGAQVLLNLGRMQNIRELDPVNNTITVEAGCILADIQQAAERAGKLFPLSLAAEGTARIGGNLSTNAGGTGVLRYGNTRELVLGLEVVLPSGEVWGGLRGLRKDNTGYDLKHLFVGAEGTLGVITAAVMKLYPLPAARVTAVAALASPAKALELLQIAQRNFAEKLTGFELFSGYCLRLVLKHFGNTINPFQVDYPQYVLLELSEPRSGAEAQQALEQVLGEASDTGVILDAVMAQNLAQSAGLWSLRENISEAQAHEGKNIKHDISVPISRIGQFIEATDAALAARFPGVQLVTFGHLGDGNLHYNVSPSDGADEASFMALLEPINRVVHDSVARHSGSISAEHGIGLLKRDELKHYKSAFELDLMKRIKHALDPLGIMNPGKVL
ncbi:MAG: FAD-binding oxidoreductase [Betaproteobacteria bacterium]|nr:FAD-binding oxidoreductase [Betaproteobacteria bacterium]